MGAACRKPNYITANTSASSDDLPFCHLNDDVILHIFSFVSFSPFEKERSSTMTLSSMRRSKPNDEETKRLLRDYNRTSAKLRKNVTPFREQQYYYQEAFGGNGISGVSSIKTFGTLTHVLPLVNKRFYELCKESNMLWMEALERLLGMQNSNSWSDLGSSVLWEKGLLSFIESSGDCPEQEPSHIHYDSGDETNLGLIRARELISKASACILHQSQPQSQTSSNIALQILKAVLHHKPFRLPIFTMHYDVTTGQELVLRLFEPRYRLLVADIMSTRSENEHRGFPLSPPRPRFLFACKAADWKQKAACIVDIRRCHIHRDGVADVVIVPVSWVLMEDVCQRPESNGLLDATVVRNPPRSTLPVFCMHCRLTLGQSVHLHFFEKRYKLMIRELMAGRSEEERNRAPVSEPRPKFIFACQTPVESGNVACLVEVVSCRMGREGTADLMVEPCSWVLIEALSMRPNSGKLFEATVLHPSKDVGSLRRRR